MKKTFGFIMVGTNNLAESEKFYNAIFLPLDLCQVLTTERLHWICSKRQS